jgi:hypothetical protein
MTLRTSRQQRTVEAIVETDRRLAADNAERVYVAESCELAPLSYEAMRLLRGTPALGEALAALADDLVRAQVVRFLVERRAATGALWGWGDVDDVEGAFRRLIATTRGEQLAARIGRAQARKIAEMMQEEDAVSEPETTEDEYPECRNDGEPGLWVRTSPAEEYDDARVSFYRQWAATVGGWRWAAVTGFLGFTLPYPTGPEAWRALGETVADVARRQTATPEAVGPRCPRCKQLFGPDGRCACPVAPIAPTAGQVEAALLSIETDAARRERYAHDAGDGDGIKLAAREAQAARDAAALVVSASYRAMGNGDLLVRSPRGMWHRVGRVPADGEGYSPVACSCEWGTKSSHVGPCKHEALYDGYYQALDAAVAQLDDEAAYRHLTQSAA